MFPLLKHSEESTACNVQMHLFYMITDDFNQAKRIKSTFYRIDSTWTKLVNACLHSLRLEVLPSAGAFGSPAASCQKESADIIA